MAHSRAGFESNEHILGFHLKAKDWVEYTGVLKVRDSGQKPVSLAMTIVLPQPFLFNMPETYSIRTKSVTEAYAKVVKFFRRFGIELRNGWTA